MAQRPGRALLCLAAVSCAISIAARADAELGGDLRSVERDRARMNAAVSSVHPMGRYTVHEMTADSGATVREFATSDGRIFAVAWRGPVHPDYRQLLGAYFPRLQQAARPRQARRAPVIIDTPEFFFEVAGHVGDMAGRACIPQMVPSGVGAEDIK
jgi:hypothetical protein